MSSNVTRCIPFWTAVIMFRDSFGCSVHNTFSSRGLGMLPSLALLKRMCSVPQITEVQQPLEVPTPHSSHGLGLEKFTGHPVACHPLDLVKVEAVLLRGASHRDPNRYSSSTTTNTADKNCQKELCRG